jgi:hypothetical protein
MGIISTEINKCDYFAYLSINVSLIKMERHIVACEKDGTAGTLTLKIKKGLKSLLCLAG